VAPRSPGIDAPPAFGGGVTTQLTTTDTIRFTITLDPWHSTTYNLGAGNALTFPAGSVCDPAKSSYGDGQWDKPCVAARTSVSETVTAWLDSQGHPQVDFSKDLRFVPSVLPTGWVTLTFADYEGSLDPMFNILYCKTPTSCVNESKKDPTLLTTHDPVSGKLTRRIKHFSGYLIGAGDGDGGSNAMNKAPIAPTLSSAVSGSAALQTSVRRSGYILASGI
ncbi:MAG: hypothetical protein ABI205_08715, partial [Gemmatimonadaceae bacterium]